MADNVPQRPDLSVVIVNWNTREELGCCLNSVRKSDLPEIETLVVDNASSDGSAEMVRAGFPWARLIVNDDNLGFSKASNIGIRESAGRYVMLLNPDTLVGSDAFGKLVRFGDDNPDVGLFGPKILNFDGSLQYSCRRFPTLAAGLFRNSILGRFFPNNAYTKDYLMKDWDHGKVRDVDWLSGAALVIRREFMDDVGILDERFFMYCEDVDLGYRAHQSGWRVVYYPHATIMHAIARGSDKNQNRMIAEFHKSMYRFFRKHYTADSSIPVRMLVPLGLFARASFFIVRNWFSSARDVFAHGRRGRDPNAEERSSEG